MHSKIIDNHGRPLTYLRLSVTDRCNLRCSYCMPHENMEFVPRKNLLTFEEMLRLVRLFASMGVQKVRITGGEPFVRKDIIHFFRDLSEIEGIEWHLTTNGILTYQFMDQLKEYKLKGLNLSLDTLNPEKFNAITKRDSLHKVMETFYKVLEKDIPLKVNMVAMKGINEEDIIPMAQLANKHPVEVRFIEEMPFDGESRKKDSLSHSVILLALSQSLPLVKENFNSTAQRYTIKGWIGKIGIIPAYSRTFCGSCNRIRINATGKLKTCLYGKDELDLKYLFSTGMSDDEIRPLLLNAFNQRAKNGFEAELQNNFQHQSMATIGG